MATRILTYVLLAVISALLPAAVWADFIVPLGVWRQAVDSTARQPRLASPIPSSVRKETKLFVALVLPPTIILSSLGASDTDYGSFASTVTLGGSSHRAPMPPGKAALQWFALGFPFWLALIASGSELLRLAIRRYRRSTLSLARVTAQR